MKKCSKCKQEKTLDSFNKKGKGLQPWCRECNSIKCRQYYQDNKEAHKKVIYKNRKKFEQRNQEYICRLLLENPCADCGETNILVLEFDHLRDKKKDISRLMRWSKISKLQEEIDKCDIVCRNCHSIRTANRVNNYRVKFLASLP